MTKNHIVAALISIAFATGFFFLCDFSFASLKTKPADKQPASHASQQIPEQSSLDKTLLRLECLKIHPKDEVNCENEIKKADPVKKNQEEQQAEGTGNFFIPVIDFLLICGLAIQIFLALYTKYLSKNPAFDSYIFYISDWAINTPPILGVLANLISFALALSKNGGGINIFFEGYFYEAVITTLIGGTFYVINLGLAIIILPPLKNA